MTNEQLKVVIEQAKNIAQLAHQGQKRIGGGDYFIDHVSKVADDVEDRLKPIAYLHDTVEDTTIKIEDLRGAGFPEYIITAVDVLTHKNNEPNVSYWTKIAQNKDAAEVKIADIKNNLSSNPSLRQVEKYQQALQLFKKFGYHIPTM